MSLPRADDLFRPTAVPDDVDGAPDAREGEAPGEHPRGKPRAVAPAPEPDSAVEVGKPRPEEPAEPRGRTPSGRVKHDEKMTVYVTSEELLDLEHARLTLRRTLGSAVDRGRLVRAAVALALADLEENGEDSALVRRLTGS